MCAGGRFGLPRCGRKEGVTAPERVGTDGPTRGHTYGRATPVRGWAFGHPRRGRPEVGEATARVGVSVSRAATDLKVARHPHGLASDGPDRGHAHGRATSVRGWAFRSPALWAHGRSCDTRAGGDRRTNPWSYLWPCDIRSRVGVSVSSVVGARKELRHPRGWGLTDQPVVILMAVRQPCAGGRFGLPRCGRTDGVAAPARVGTDGPTRGHTYGRATHVRGWAFGLPRRGRPEVGEATAWVGV